jgi:hypothetical protein
MGINWISKRISKVYLYGYFTWIKKDMYWITLVDILEISGVYIPFGYFMDIIGY